MPSPDTSAPSKTTNHPSTALDPAPEGRIKIKRRSNVVGIFPDDASVIRLVGAVLPEQHDEWAATESRYLSDESMARIDQHLTENTTTQHTELPAA